MTAAELIAKLQKCPPDAEVSVDFVKELHGVLLDPGDCSVDLCAVTLYQREWSSTSFVTLQLGTARMLNGLDPFTPFVCGEEATL